MTPREVGALLGAGGPLASKLPGFRPRQVQQRMAEAVAETVSSAGRLVVEAGTGTGKTYAYLVPLLASGRRAIVSTGTLNLQDQLFVRDLPRLREALAAPLRASVLKGRANYLCRYRLQQSLANPGLRHEHARLREITAWSKSTATGELQELEGFNAQDSLAPRISSTAENCLGSRCGEFERCHVVKARRAAQGADLVVVNHHLLLADFALKQEGFGELLPGAEAVVVDEAHLLPELATRFFGLRLSTRQLHELAQDADAELHELGDVPAQREHCKALSTAASALEDLFRSDTARQALERFLAQADAPAVLKRAREALEQLAQSLTPLAERGAGVAACAQRTQDFAQRLARLLQTESDPDHPDLVRWTESHGNGGALLAAPLRPADSFQNLLDAHPGAWIFTSATLAVGEDFSLFLGELGLKDAQTLRLDSPYDLAQQTRLYCPPGLPDPADPHYTDRVVDAALPVIAAAGGGVFLLCTSYRALHHIAARLRAADLKHPLFVQGEASRAELLQRFARAGDGILVGTSSFWQGVDVKGPALRVVIIDKLPFTSPGDPVFEARLRSIRAGGGEPFTEYQLPQAIVSLRQGIGRLIRDEADQGLLMLCDPRLFTRGYGARVLASLPEMPLLRELPAACAWLQSLGANCGSGFSRELS